MKKSDLLQAIESAVREGTVTRSEAVSAADRGASASGAPKSLNIAEILYYIGGAIVAIGIAVLIGQNWDQLSTMTRIVATFGSGLAAYVAGVALLQDKRFDRVAQAMFFISGIVLPLGFFVMFDQSGFDVSLAGVNTVISAILFAAFLTSLAAFKKNIFLIFSLAYGTWLFFAITSYLIQFGPIFVDWRFYLYRFLVTGIAYVLLGYSFKETDKKDLVGFLYGVGVFTFLGAALGLGGWSPENYIIWELLFPGLVFAVIFLSIHMKSKAFLVFGSGYLMLYILKITAEYFTDSMGWPLALVLAGFVLMGVGYLTFSLNKRYLKSA